MKIVLDRKKMELKNILVNPKIMAASGLLAMVPKGIVTASLAFSAGLFFSKSCFWSFCFVLYPIIGTLLDIVLYVMKNKLWTAKPEQFSVPEDWKISPEELLQFAKELPKVRLMRYVGCLLVLPFMSFDKGSMFTVMFSWMLTGYFIFALFDGLWLKMFKLKKPEYVIKSIKKIRDNGNFDDMSRHASRQCDATAVGSTAWFAQQSFNESSRLDFNSRG